MPFNKKKTRRDTKLESEAAEFLVLGRLLLEKVTAFKTYTNLPGYDLIATNAENNTSARIQVKSRYNTNWDGFIIKNFDCDFVVLVPLNRGFSRPRKDDFGVREPEFYVFPINYIHTVRDSENEWGKIVKSRLSGIDQYYICFWRISAESRRIIEPLESYFETRGEKRWEILS